MTCRKPVVVALSALILASAMLPSAAYAQRRGGGGVAVRGRVGVAVAPRRTVVVGGFYRPYYSPFFYGFYDPFYYPYYWSYPPYYGYGYGGGYGGYYGRYDLSSSLRIQVTPKETEVFIDGYYAGTVDEFDGFFQRLHLEPGEHDLQLYLPGYRSVTEKVYLQPGNTFRVKHAMEPLGPGDPEPVRPTATAPPPPAQTQAPRQAPGPIARQPRDRGPVRQAPRSPNDGTYGTLTLRVQPGSADIRIDGERWDGPQGDERLVVQLSSGRHVIEIQRDGYRQYMTEVTVQAGETATLNVALTRQ